MSQSDPNKIQPSIVSALSSKPRTFDELYKSSFCKSRYTLRYHIRKMYRAGQIEMIVSGEGSMIKPVYRLKNQKVAEGCKVVT